ncbi:MAG: hypothetical protein HYV40_05835 [Candidatus Levybacteria bacterium]|nr:hypothetical protein [Candidatus Levybacteria bacterium]
MERPSYYGNFAIPEAITIHNPHLRDVTRVITNIQNDPDAQVVRVTRDSLSKRVISTGTFVPYVLIKHDMVDALGKLIDGFCTSDEVVTELVIMSRNTPHETLNTPAT